MTYVRVNCVGVVAKCMVGVRRVVYAVVCVYVAR